MELQIDTAELEKLFVKEKEAAQKRSKVLIVSCSSPTRACVSAAVIDTLSCCFAICHYQVKAKLAAAAAPQAQLVDAKRCQNVAIPLAAMKVRAKP